jgi:hypothetical protein
LDRLKLALACTIKLNGILNKIFGEDLFSRRAFWRTSQTATGFLIASLALVGILNHDTFGVKPWENYRKTAESVISTIPIIQAQYREAAKPTLVTNNLPTGVDIKVNLHFMGHVVGGRRGLVLFHGGGFVSLE